MRLIDADALIQSLEKKHAHWHELVGTENKEIEFAHSYALNVIRNAPTIKEVDNSPTVKARVITCERCVNWMSRDDINGVCTLADIGTAGDTTCEYAEEGDEYD